MTMLINDRFILTLSQTMAIISTLQRSAHIFRKFYQNYLWSRRGTHHLAANRIASVQGNRRQNLIFCQQCEKLVIQK